MTDSDSAECYAWCQITSVKQADNFTNQRRFIECAKVKLFHLWPFYRNAYRDNRARMSSHEMKSSYDNEGYVGDGRPDPNANVMKKGMEASRPSSGRFDNLTGSEAKRVRFGIIKNVVVISIAFMLLFTAFQSMAALQSSLNKVGHIWYYYQFFHVGNGLFLRFCFSGCRPRNLLAVGDLWGPRRVMHVRAVHHDQEVDRQVDHGRLDLLLLDLHCRPILPRVLHPHPGSYHPWNGRGSYVERQVHLPFPGMKLQMNLS